MMSERIYLNNDWKFAEQFEASMTEAAYDDSVMQNVRLPHTCKETPLHYFDEHCYQMVSGYRRVIEAEEAWKGKKILLTIDGAAHDSEVFLNGDTYLQNGQFSLKGNSSNAITKNLFADGWPQIKGYVSASPKTGANVLLASVEKDDPILSVMQYGLGHTVAWNTDVTNRWTAGLAQQNDYVQLWKRIIDYSAGNTALGEDRVDVTTVNGTTKVTYYAKDYAEQTQVEAVYTDPDGKTHQAKLTASAPGTYEAQLDTTVSGVYNLSVQRKNGKKIENALTTAAVVQYSQEYKFALTNDSFCAFIKQYGKMLSPKKNVWKKLKASGRARVCLTNPLLILLLFVFLADIAMRRFAYVPPMPHWTRPAKKAIMTKEKTAEDGQPEPEAEKPMEKIKKTKPEETASQALDTSALLKKKEKRNHSV